MNNKQDLFERGNADEYEYNIQRSFFPPSKSSAEYETTILELSKEIADLQKKNDELAALRARVEELEGVLDRIHKNENGSHYSKFVARAALSPKGKD
jgi:hypothetical protein